MQHATSTQVDASSLPGVPDQRMLALINTYVVHTTELLNSVAATCEQRLQSVHSKYAKISCSNTSDMSQAELHISKGSLRVFVDLKDQVCQSCKQQDQRLKQACLPTCLSCRAPLLTYIEVKDDIATGRTHQWSV